MSENEKKEKKPHPLFGMNYLEAKDFPVQGWIVGGQHSGNSPSNTQASGDPMAKAREGVEAFLKSRQSGHQSRRNRD